MLRFMGSQTVGHDWATDLIWSENMFESLEYGDHIIAALMEFYSIILWTMIREADIGNKKSIYDYVICRWKKVLL